MSENEEEGKKWVEDKLQELAEKHHVQLESLWYFSNKDKGFDRDLHSLKILSNTGESRKINFPGNDLRDCPADETKRAEWEGLIEEVVKSLVGSRGKK